MGVQDELRAQPIVVDAAGIEKNGDGTPVYRIASHGEGETIDTSKGTTTKRGISSQQAQMLTIAGAIGTSLFVGTGQALYISGPAPLFGAYIVMCALVYCVVTATSEMNTYLPVPGNSMSYYAGRFASPSLGLALGYLYWYSFGIIVAYEITAASIVIKYWPNNVHVAVWITIMMVVVVALNFLPVRAYGESEFWFRSTKVITIVGLLILSFTLFWGGGPSHQRLGFHYWKRGLATKEYLTTGHAGEFCAFLYVLCYSTFSFNFAPEMLVFTGGEMKEPRRNLPRAAKHFFIRLLVFYIGGALAIGVICDSNAAGLVSGGSDAAASPWVIAIRNAGISGFDSVINAVILTSAWSSGNSYLYMSSRALYSMAVAGSAPKIFARCNKWGVPYVAVGTSSLFALLAYMNVSTSAGDVFNWLISLTNAAGFLSWSCCSIVYIRFVKACRVQGRNKMPYRSHTQPYAIWVCAFAFPILLLCNGFSVFFPGQWSTSTFLTAYIGFPISLFIYTAHRIRHWSDRWLHHPAVVDLTTGLAEIEADKASHEPKAGRGDSIWSRALKAIWD